MTLQLYFDVHVAWAVTAGLRMRSVDVLTAQDDASDELPDGELLNRATALSRVVFTQDTDFLAEAHSRQKSGEPFAGIIYVHQDKLTFGQIIADLELMAKVYDPPDMANRVEYLPLR